MSAVEGRADGRVYCFSGAVGSVRSGVADDLATLPFDFVGFFVRVVGLLFCSSMAWQAATCSALVRRTYPCSLMQGLLPAVPATAAAVSPRAKQVAFASSNSF